MKQKLLFSCFVIFSFFAFSQNSIAPPEPCTQIHYYSCDLNEDGFEVFNLVEFYPFHFCRPQELSVNYYPTTFYVTKEDSQNGTNAITNPESYVNLTNPQTIYSRAEPLNSSTDEVLTYFDVIRVALPPTASNPEHLVYCDLYGNGFREFNLYEKNLEILSGQDSNIYGVIYYETQEDAELSINAIDGEAYTNTMAYSQIVYAKIYLKGTTSACEEIVELKIIVEDKCENLSVSLLGIAQNPRPRPGFNYNNRLIINNLGKAIDSGMINVEIDLGLEIVSTFIDNPNFNVEQVGNNLNIEFNNFEEGGRVFFDINMYCPASTELGVLTSNFVSYITNENDYFKYNDKMILNQIVEGSYDPNDINESRGPSVLFEDFTNTDYLYYTVRFQNIGTAEAITVRIEDTLNTLLDATTFQMIQSSHDYQVNREGNQLTWTFNDINLPAESQDAEGSNGYVHFKIKPLSGYSVGTIIPAQAEIYFDFNAPVITNTFETTFIEENLSVNDSKLSGFTIFPNPAKVNIQIDFNTALNNKAGIEIYDLNGRIVIRKEFKAIAKMEIDVSDLNSGIYMLKVKNNSRGTIKKLIIK